jgi:hypothetical protein
MILVKELDLIQQAEAEQELKVEMLEVVAEKVVLVDL